MLLTLMVTPRLPLPKGKGASIDLTALPAFVRDQFAVHGLSISTEILSGITREGLTALREAADRAACACLMLVEPRPLTLGAPDAAPALARAERLVEAASVLGCNAVAMGINAAEKDTDTIVERLKAISARADRRELNVLISPTEGLTADPERVTDLIKKVGGFRIGTFPDFEAASRWKDPTSYLRRLVPYAGGICASTLDFVEGEPHAPKPAQIPDDPFERELRSVIEEIVAEELFEHRPYSLESLVSVAASVGFEGTLSIDYRGPGDVTLGVRRTRGALERCLEGLSGA